MQEYIQTLLEHGFAEEQARLFVQNIAQFAYDAGESAGRDFEHAIVGQTLGQSGQDFYDWFDEQTNQ